MCRKSDLRKEVRPKNFHFASVRPFDGQAQMPNENRGATAEIVKLVAVGIEPKALNLSYIRNR